MVEGEQRSGEISLERGRKPQENVPTGDLIQAFADIDTFLWVNVRKQIHSLETLSQYASPVGPALLVVFNARAKPEREEGITYPNVDPLHPFTQPSEEERFIEHVIRGRVGNHTIQLSASNFYPTVTIEAYKLKRGWQATMFEVTIPTDTAIIAYKDENPYTAGWLCSASDEGWWLKLPKVTPDRQGIEIPRTKHSYSPLHPHRAEDILKYGQLLQRGVRELRSILRPPQPLPNAFAHA